MKAIIKALHHVRQHHPTVTFVVFFPCGRWQYFTDDAERPTFGSEVDTDVLEAAMIEAENHALPALYRHSFVI